MQKEVKSAIRKLLWKQSDGVILLSLIINKKSYELARVFCDLWSLVMF